MPELVFKLSDEDVARIAADVVRQLGASPPAAAVEPWVGAETAAAHLACRPQRLYDLVHAGRIPHGKDGRRVLFKLSELDEWLDAGGAEA